MATIDGTTPLPDDAIQRVLYIHHPIHVYQIPPLTSTKGHTAAQWTNNPPLFTARLRIIETAIPTSSAAHSNSASPSTSAYIKNETVTTTLLLEDASTGDLFAAAPYTHPSVVEHALDSARFFAVRVVGDGGRRKATLGMGFEERSDAFDFGVCLQEVRKVLGFNTAAAASESAQKGPQSATQNGRGPARGRGPPIDTANAGAGAKAVPEVKRDLSLKEGETITVNIGALGKHSGSSSRVQAKDSPNGSSPVVPMLAPPPTAREVKRRSREFAGSFAPPEAVKETKPQTAEELGFDDGEFGEFQ